MARLILRRCLHPANTQKERALAEIHEKVGKVNIPCPSCVAMGRAAGPAQEPHPCPMAQDLDGDSETLCICCQTCQDSCADDI